MVDYSSLKMLQTFLTNAHKYKIAVKTRKTPTSNQKYSGKIVNFTNCDEIARVPKLIISKMIAKRKNRMGLIILFK